MIVTSADTLLLLINDILDFSKIEARKLNLEAIPFQLRDNLGNTLQTLALRAADKGLELAYHIPPEVPDTLIGDSLRGASFASGGRNAGTPGSTGRSFIGEA